MMMINKINSWKNPLLLLLSIGISNIGAWIYLIALNLIILEKTSSPLAVSVLYILKPLASVFSNFWTGSLIDRMNKRKIMIILDFVRTLLIFFLPFLSALWIIYFLVFAINIASSIFYPTSMIYMTKLIPMEERKKFNSFRSLVSSGAFVLGPSIAGFLFMIGTPEFSILLNAMALFLSGLITYFLPDLEKRSFESESDLKFSFKLFREDMGVVIRFYKKHKKMMNIILLFNMVMVMSASIDSLEASFSKEVLTLSNSQYGLLVSLAGVGFVIGSIVNSLLFQKIATLKLISIGTLFITIGYVVYSFSSGFSIAAFGFILLSFSQAFANIGYDTFYQNNIPISIMGRIGSYLGLFHAFFVVIFTISFGFTAKIFSIQQIVILGASFMLIFSILLIYIVFIFKKTKHSSNQSNGIINLQITK